MTQLTSLAIAEPTVGGLSNTSKMPSASWSISANRCKTGRKLAKVKGSVCNGCYALKGRYTFGTVQFALERRLDSWENHREQWREAMIYLMHHKKSILAKPHFRWFDSGDIQSAEMLDDINAVAYACPNVSFWMPSKEYKIAREYMRNNAIAPNLLIRMSAPMIDQPLPGFAHTSVVYSKENLPEGQGLNCPAPNQGNQCGDCRACWEGTTRQVNYHAH